jgi:hypothetical protein
MDLGYDLLTNKKKIKKIKKTNEIENENDLLNHIKDIIIQNEECDILPFIKLSEVKLLNIIKTSIDEYKNFIFDNNKKNIETNKKIINNNDNKIINNNTTKKITINLSKK